jgi:hypothetical protein
VTDAAGNVSDNLSVTTFITDTVAPLLTEVAPVASPTPERLGAGGATSVDGRGKLRLDLDRNSRQEHAVRFLGGLRRDHP